MKNGIYKQVINRFIAEELTKNEGFIDIKKESIDPVEII